jgi:hypothetical protein
MDSARDRAGKRIKPVSPGQGENPMDNFYFERECRTQQSECYTVMKEENPVGRLDIHFANQVVHATLNVIESLTTEDVQDLIDAVDEELVDAVGVERQEMIVHVHQGRDLGVFTSRNFEGNGGHEHMN